MRFGVLGPLTVWEGEDTVVVGPPKQRALLAALAAARPDAVLVEMGVPGPLPPTRGLLVTGGASRASGRAAAEALTGGTP